MNKQTKELKFVTMKNVLQFLPVQKLKLWEVSSCYENLMIFLRRVFCTFALL